MTHNQGVPGSCPGGPTEGNSTVSRVYEVKFINPFSFGLAPGQVLAKFCVFKGKTGVNRGEGVELSEPDRLNESIIYQVITNMTVHKNLIHFLFLISK